MKINNRRPFFATTLKELQKTNWIIIALMFVTNAISIFGYYKTLRIEVHLFPICILFANIIIYIINFVKISKVERIERKYKKFMSGFIPSVMSFVICLVMWIIIFLK